LQTYLNISRGKAYDLFKEKGFPTLVIGRNKRVLKEDFLSWVEKQKGKAQ
ncbi:DNA-binding protein, partial [Pseudomonas syringae pv. syringae]